MTAIIIDDEKHCRDVLALLLQRYCSSLNLVASCPDGESGLEAIDIHRPDVVFLDIEMPGMSGFEMLEATRYNDFQVIFTTAYNEYAIKAIRHNALDYILKPINKDELVSAVSRIRQHTTSNVHNFVDYLAKQKVGDRIELPTSDGLQNTSKRGDMVL